MRRVWLCGLGVLAFGLALSLSPRARAAEPVDFAMEVLPLLEERCFKCHAASFRGRKKKPKGGLRLDGSGWILRGGNGGRAVVSRKPEVSLLHARISLPDSHDDVMPPDGDVFAKAEIDLIERWVREGANFGSWKGADGPKTVVPTKTDPETATTPRKVTPSIDRYAIYRQLAQDLKPASMGALKALRAAGARVTSVVPGSPLLRVEFMQDAAMVTDATLKILTPLRKHIGMLSLDSTKITDNAATILGTLPHLVRLDLQRTKITDKGIEALAKTPPRHLRRLNLYGTGVTDQSVAAMTRFTGLRRVFLWKTKVSSAGVQQLRSMLPQCEVSAQRILPTPEQPSENGNRRRRRN